MPLFLAAASGKRTVRGTIAFVKPGTTPVTALSYELGNVIISSYTSANGYESLTLGYETITLSFTPQKADGTLLAPIKGGWNFITNIKL